ncbi:hypothetical protein C8N46_103293 [Kordia periserrulae]|uniref:Endosialidase-like protein n=1 Tax=Kordia periserrulae TaxID=701523 RepID=A0A2T6C1J1_9FLAO|nr:hypothetical protein [Kordia periserrulae]PTX62194.1 hypothetical protein C8N46_103293 [Kordia periserrulae]
MKKLTFLLTILIVSTIQSQNNTFPTTGNVGIGTTTPTDELEVLGTIKAEKAILTNNGNPAFALQIGSEWTTNRRNFDFYVNNNPSTNTSAQLQFLMTDENSKWRFGITNSLSTSTMVMYDENGAEFFKIDEGSITNNKVYLQMPKSDSRIVIGQYATYEPSHKFVVKDGSALIEGDIFTDSNIGIGTTDVGGTENWKLAVNGKVRAKEVKVETGWSDFVFESNYALPSLEEVEQHINEKGHLKDIPSAKEVAENGILLGEMDSKLLQKIEELTLYMIEMNKEIKTLKEENKILKQKLNVKN